MPWSVSKAVALITSHACAAMNDAEVRWRAFQTLETILDMHCIGWLTCRVPPPQVGKQISQMVRFIKQEAEEKANEIAISAEEVCTELCSVLVHVYSALAAPHVMQGFCDSSCLPGV